MTQSVISEENKMASTATSMSFKKFGDKIEGTLTDKRMATVQKYMSQETEEKMVYELKVPAGQTIIQDGVPKTLAEEEKWAVWGKPDGKSGIDAQLKTVSLGQIVGFVYEGDKPNKRFPKNPLKLIEVYQNKKVVDMEWLQSDEATQKKSEEVGTMPDFTADETEVEELSKKFNEDVPFTDKLHEILELAKAKFGVTTDEDAKAKTMEATNLAFISVNYDKILELLK